MATLLLIRHGRTTANAGGLLAGRTPGVELDDHGRAQAAALGLRLAGVPLAAVVSSPLERTRQTSAALLDARVPGAGPDPAAKAAAPADPHAPAADPDAAPAKPARRRTARAAAAPEPIPLHLEDRINECDYGHWAGRELKILAKEPLWPVVQNHPSAVTFPGGESMTRMSARAVEAVRDWNEQLGPEACYAMVSHGDVIKAIIADALGMHLDLFQRIQVDPCSVTVIRYTQMRPFLLRINDTDSPVGTLVPARSKARSGRRRPDGDAQIGGGSGAPAAR
ncbi:MAG TPA: MSMEG_4193 family putative phosphomutase [Actinocrinis sp.]|nr:MSMEG_4193 family putative phosphomutase [Actinocrinis sp.]